MPKARAKQTLKPYPLRLPEDLYNAIATIAEQEVRPVNSQMIVFLREAVAQWESQQPPSQWEAQQPSAQGE
jgi:hypothetical protein